MKTHIGDKIFQNTPHRVAKFRENRPRYVEKSVVGKKIKHGQNITVFRYRWSDTRATVIMQFNSGQTSTEQTENHLLQRRCGPFINSTTVLISPSTFKGSRSCSKVTHGDSTNFFKQTVTCGCT